MSGKKIFLITLAVAALILIASKWSAVQAAIGIKPKDATGSDGLTGTGGTSTGSSSTPAAPAQLDYNKVLRKGVKGNEVRLLQQWLYDLNKNGKRVVTRYSADGDFGTETESLLRSYMNTTSTTLGYAQNALGAPTPSTATPTYASAGGSVANAATSFLASLGWTGKTFVK